MATPMQRGQFENITNLGLALRAAFFDQVEFMDPLWSIAGVVESGRAAERMQSIGGFGDVPEFTGAIEYDSMQQLYRTTFEHKEYALGMSVERKLVDDEEYGIISQRAQQLGLTFDRSATKALAGVLNNSFSSSVAGGDSVELCGAHPYSPTNASTQTNAGTSALTHDALVATRIAMMQFKDSRENPLNCMPDTLIVPVGLYDTANVIVNSAQQSGNANNDINTNAQIRVVTSHYLTDANNWWLVDSRMARMHWLWFWRTRPEFQDDPTSDYNLAMRYRGYMRYSFGWDAWQWVYGHEVT